MKKIIYITSLLITISSNSKAQNTLPVEEVVNYINSKTGIPRNITQIKDVNNILGKYVGTWKGTHNNKKYEFRAVKYIDKSTIGNITAEDILVMSYKIIDSNGMVLEDTTTLPNSDPFVIQGRYVNRTGGYVLSYQGKEYSCGQFGDVFISVYGTNRSKMQFYLVPGRDTILYPENCPNQVTHLLPTDAMELIKQ